MANLLNKLQISIQEFCIIKCMWNEFLDQCKVQGIVVNIMMYIMLQNKELMLLSGSRTVVNIDVRGWIYQLPLILNQVKKWYDAFYMYLQYKKIANLTQHSFL